MPGPQVRVHCHYHVCVCVCVCVHGSLADLVMVHAPVSKGYTQPLTFVEAVRAADTRIHVPSRPRLTSPRQCHGPTTVFLLMDQLLVCSCADRFLRLEDCSEDGFMGNFRAAASLADQLHVSPPIRPS